jgi:hypothetical protein
MQFWKTRKRKPRREKDSDKKLRFAFKFALSACGPAGDKRAWYYEVALQIFLNRGTKPEYIKGEIERAGGISKLYRLELARRRETRAFQAQMKPQKELEPSFFDIDAEGESTWAWLQSSNRLAMTAPPLHFVRIVHWHRHPRREEGRLGSTSEAFGVI